MGDAPRHPHESIANHNCKYSTKRVKGKGSGDKNSAKSYSSVR
ncbi:hypothetical protein HMPREF9136_1048 [Prevotella dentalis DSM 3688]|uniref:Uncharacterized protein n=1 Tax=Prevotella dentalis (strain ATCC 49559 / DSM 3688 / JCM 13448 / NCTC 12043 / ES 2772) TaxID=908937 RepID=F9D289_PREDD|nr:hypothetical protein HMPREF9136_1048 [Prevotella dentalis DSM 3688]